jgi:hypothetical protein
MQDYYSLQNQYSNYQALAARHLLSPQTEYDLFGVLTHCEVVLLCDDSGV